MTYSDCAKQEILSARAHCLEQIAIFRLRLRAFAGGRDDTHEHVAQLEACVAGYDAIARRFEMH